MSTESFSILLFVLSNDRAPATCALPGEPSSQVLPAPRSTACQTARWEWALPKPPAVLLAIAGGYGLCPLVLTEHNGPLPCSSGPLRGHYHSGSFVCPLPSVSLVWRDCP